MMMKKFTFFCVIAFSISSAFSQAPAASNAIMLQGFHWDSNHETSWTQLYQISGDIAGYFDYVWLPPSAYSSGGTGYHPKQWSNQNSDWGSEANLKKLIHYLKEHHCKAIADIVVNHRDNMSSWCDFYPDNFGAYGAFQLTAAHICKDDEVNNVNSNSGACKGSATGANDSGEKYGAARDLDHTNPYVRDAVKAYLLWMKNEMGYSGWRYDVAKGFSAQYFGEYNDAANAEISVGEYFDGGYDLLWGWINGTGNRSMAFDFAFKFRALNNGLAKGNYNEMAWTDLTTTEKYRCPAGLVHSQQSRRYAVTFIENHDTQIRQNDNCNCNYSGDILKAHAFMLSAAGIPCIFYPHWQDATYKADIQEMMKARKAVGLHSESNVTVQNTSGYYKAYSVGTFGEMLTYIGSSNSAWASDAPTSGGWTLSCSGTGWAMYTKITDETGKTAYQNKITAGVNPPAPQTFTSITLTATVPSAWTEPKIHVWAGNTRITNSDWPGQAMTQVSENRWTITLSEFSAISEVGVVINNGVMDNLLQTIDLFASKNTCWIVDEMPTGTKYGATEVACATEFVPVRNISHVPTSTFTGTPLILTGMVEPSTATNKTITSWTIKGSDTTGTIIIGNILNATAQGIVTITATVENGLGTGSHYTQDFDITITDTVTEVINIRNIPTNRLMIYPNPVDNMLRIEAEHEISKVTVLSILGQSMINSNKSTLDVSTLNSGIYLLKVEFVNSQVIFGKFLKK